MDNKQQATTAANLEDALSLSEMELIADIFDPVHRHKTRIEYGGPESELADSIYERLLSAIRRQKYHDAVANTRPEVVEHPIGRLPVGTTEVVCANTVLINPKQDELRRQWLKGI